MIERCDKYIWKIDDSKMMDEWIIILLDWSVFHILFINGTSYICNFAWLREDGW